MLTLIDVTALPVPEDTTEPTLPAAPVSPLSPLGIVKLNFAADEVPALVTAALVPAAPVVTVTAAARG